jgi:hypothetical protein
MPSLLSSSPVLTSLLISAMPLAVALALGLGTLQPVQGPPPPEPPLLLPAASLFVHSAEGWVLPGHSGLGPHPLAIPARAISERVTCFEASEGRLAFRIHAGRREDGSPHTIDAIVLDALQHSADHEILVVEGVPWLLGPGTTPARIERASPDGGEPEDVREKLLRQDLECVQGGLIEIHPPEDPNAPVDSMILIGGEEPFGQQGWNIGYSYRQPRSEGGGWFEGYSSVLPSTPRQATSLPVPAELLRIQLTDEARIDRLFYATVTLPQEHHFRRLDLAHARLGSGVRGDTYQRGGQGPQLFRVEFAEDDKRSIDKSILMTRVAEGDGLTQELEENDLLEISFDSPPAAAEGKTWTLLVRVIYPDEPEDKQDKTRDKSGDKSRDGSDNEKSGG